MSLVIRLAKIGKKGEAKYRLVVKEKRSKRDGKALEFLGFYEKRERSENKQIDLARVKYWISAGAKPSPTVSKILSK